MFENHPMSFESQPNRSEEHMGMASQPSVVQIGHVSMPKLTIPAQQMQMPTQGLTHWSPTSSDSGETEKDDTSRNSLASQRFAANMLMNGSMEDKNFFNLPSNSSDMHPLESTSSSSVFEFARPSGSHFPSNMDAPFNNNGHSFPHEHDRSVDPKVSFNESHHNSSLDANFFPPVLMKIDARKNALPNANATQVDVRARRQGCFSFLPQ